MGDRVPRCIRMSQAALAWRMHDIRFLSYPMQYSLSPPLWRQGEEERGDERAGERGGIVPEDTRTRNLSIPDPPLCRTAFNSYVHIKELCISIIEQLYYFSSSSSSSFFFSYKVVCVYDGLISESSDLLISCFVHRFLDGSKSWCHTFILVHLR